MRIAIIAREDGRLIDIDFRVRKGRRHAVI
jgi:hypothetical protein